MEPTQQQDSDDAANIVEALRQAALAEIDERCVCEPRVQVHAGHMNGKKGLYVVVKHTDDCEFQMALRH